MNLGCNLLPMRGRRTLRSLILGVGWHGRCQGWENSYNIVSLSLHIQIPEIIKSEYVTQFRTQGNKIWWSVGALLWPDFLFIHPCFTILFSQRDYSLLENALKCLQNSLGPAKCTAQVNSMRIYMIHLCFVIKIVTCCLAIFY